MNGKHHIAKFNDMVDNQIHRALFHREAGIREQFFYFLKFIGPSLILSMMVVGKNEGNPMIFVIKVSLEEAYRENFLYNCPYDQIWSAMSPMRGLRNIGWFMMPIKENIMLELQNDILNSH